MSRPCRAALSLILAAAALLVTAGSATGIPPPGTLEYELSYYEGRTTVILIPSATSANPNQAHFACFALGPDISGTKRAATAPPLYVVLAPGATQVACPDGSLRHDHVLSTVPGAGGYTGAWTIVLAVPGPAFDVTKMPYTSTSEIEAGVARSELVLVETGVSFIGPVVGGPPPHR